MSDWNNADYECIQATVFGLNWMSYPPAKHKLSPVAHQITVFSLFHHFSKPLGMGAADKLKKSAHFTQMHVSQIK